MAWTTPGTAVAGDVLTAAFWNEQVRDNTADLRSYQNRYARYKYTGGNITINSTTWINMPTMGTASDLVLTASSGDVIEVCASGLWNNDAVDGYVDVATVVSGSPVNSFAADGTPSNSNTGIRAWYGATSQYSSMGGSFFRTLVSGDISAGNVTLRLRVRTSSASNKILITSTDNIFEWWARNHGPVTT